MDRSLAAFALVTVAVYTLLTAVRPAAALLGLSSAARLFAQALPWIVISMLAAGLLTQLLDARVIARWLGEDQGWTGIVLGALLGLAGTGTRWTMYPIAAALLSADAGPGAVFAFVTSWQLVSLARLPAEIPFYGEEFTLVRAVVSVIVAVVGGILVDRWMR